MTTAAIELEQQRLARLRRAGGEAAGIEHAGQPGAHRRQQIDLHGQPADVDAGANRRDAAGAERIGVLAEPRLRQQVVHDQITTTAYDHQDRHRRRSGRCRARQTSRCDTGTVMPPAIRKAAPRAMPYMPSVPMNGGTRSREISQPLTRPGMKATAMPESRPSSIARNGSQTQVADAEIGDMGRDDRRQPHGEADRQVDAGGNDDEGLAERQQQRRGGEDADRLQIVGVADEGDAVGDLRPDLEEDQQQAEEQPGAQIGDPGKDAGPCGTGGGIWRSSADPRSMRTINRTAGREGRRSDRR